MAKSRAQAGFTVIELMVAVAVVSILLTVGVPAFGSLIERQQLSGAAQTFASDLRRAKSDAIAKGPGGSVTITLASDSSAGTWSYAVTNSGSTPTKNVSQADFSGVTAVVTGWGVSGGAAAFSIEAVRGLSAAGEGSITFTSGTASLTVERNLAGRVRVCSATGDFGYSACS